MAQEGKTSTTTGKYRWVICGLVFFATTVNYLDRQVISLLKDDYLSKLFTKGSEELDYANIVIVFQIAYAFGMLVAGWFIDKVGTKLGYALALLAWSFAAIIHAVSYNIGATFAPLLQSVSNFFGVGGIIISFYTLGFMIARGFLGISEAANFPAAIKTIAEWFPKKERSLATGIFNSGSNIGAIIAPLTVPFIANAWGWEWTFIITGAIGLTWLLFWFFIYESPDKHKRLSKSEYEYINSDLDEPAQSDSQKAEKVSWFSLFKYRQTWAFIIGKFLTDPVWWFYLFWLPSFLKNQYHMQKTAIAFPIAVVYCMTTVGSILGGWISSNLISRGWTTYQARKTAMLIFAICIVPVVMAQALGQFNPWYAVLIIGIAAASHQAWSANIFTTASDMFPKRAVASITGIGGMAGAVGGIIIARLAGVLFDFYKAAGHLETGYYIMFIICGTAYLLAWVLFYVVLVPRMRPVELA